MTDASAPFHAGELEAQRRAGAGDVASWASGFIRDFMPDQHRAFFAGLPFMVAASADEAGRIWVTVIEGPDGFIHSHDPQSLSLATSIDQQDPLAQRFGTASKIGLLGIELATRRRNRLSGVMAPDRDGLSVQVKQSFGNCPQYIRERAWRRVERAKTPNAVRADRQSAAQAAWIGTADTLFIGTGHTPGDDAAASGFDASHRGGDPGFVEVADAGRLRIPDYAGNNFFNTIGNLLRNPRIGLLFVDFQTGGLLHVTGRAEIVWSPDDQRHPDARRIIDIAIEAVVERPAALSLCWAADDATLRELIVTEKVDEAADVTSFYLAPADGLPLAPFKAGQHLPIDLDAPRQTGKVRRTYSLSGAPGWDRYRLTVKREDRGVASRFLHDAVLVGDAIHARRPAGEFVIPGGDRPLVLVSAGVGLTPMLSMLHAAAGADTDRPVWYVHGARDGAHHALRDEVNGLVATRPRLRRHVRFSRPRAQDRLGEDYDAQGRITAETLLSLGAGPEADYMLCGPAPFMAEVRAGLEAAGISAAHIHVEAFGTAA